MIRPPPKPPLFPYPPLFRPRTRLVLARPSLVARVGLRLRRTERGGQEHVVRRPVVDQGAAVAVLDHPAVGRHEERLAERSEEHTSELQSPCNLACRLLLEKK